MMAPAIKKGREINTKSYQIKGVLFWVLFPELFKKFPQLPPKIKTKDKAMAYLVS